jgi:hypothetical protein
VRAVLDLCKHLAANGVRVTLVTADDKDCPKEWKEGAGGPAWPSVARIDPTRRAGLFDRRFRRQVEPYVRAADDVADVPVPRRG